MQQPDKNKEHCALRTTCGNGTFMEGRGEKVKKNFLGGEQARIWDNGHSVTSKHG